MKLSLSTSRYKGPLQCSGIKHQPNDSLQHAQGGELKKLRIGKHLPLIANTKGKQQEVENTIKQKNDGFPCFICPRMGYLQQLSKSDNHGKKQNDLHPTELKPHNRKYSTAYVHVVLLEDNKEHQRYGHHRKVVQDITDAAYLCCISSTTSCTGDGSVHILSPSDCRTFRPKVFWNYSRFTDLQSNTPKK